MANLINSVIIQGNLTRDPELRYTPSGTAVANARIAHNDRVKKDGVWTDTPYYFDVTIWGNRGEAFCRFFTKGSAVLIRGRLTWREWDSENGKRQQVEIVADDWYFVGKKGEGGGTTDRYDGADYSRGGDGGGQYDVDDPAGPPATVPAGGDFDADGDDIPFALFDMCPLDGVVWAHVRRTWPPTKLHLW
jgi:single-strand DNA-binding protein